MVDYKLIADNDPGGDIETAYAAMAAETVTSTPETRLTYLSIANRVGYAAAAALYDRVIANMPAWINQAMMQGGVDVNNPQTAGILNSLVGGGFTAKMMSDIINAGVESSPKYPGLKIGHLANARQKRAAGDI